MRYETLGPLTDEDYERIRETMAAMVVHKEFEPKE